MRNISIALALFLFLPLAAPAKVTLPPVFTDNMVLQQQSKVTIWGTASPGKKVTVTTSWNGRTVQTTASKADGSWSVVFETPSYGGPYEISVADSRKPLVLKNILIGDVWICSGQSNMEMKIGDKVTGMDETLARAKDYPNIRILHIQNTTATLPSEVVPVRHGGWQTCDSQTLPDFSAAAYYFGRELNENLDIPIGLIETCWGGTLAEAWTSGESLRKMPYFAARVEEAASLPATTEARVEKFHNDIDRWREEVKAFDPAFSDGGQFWGSIDYQDSDWAEIESPGFVQDSGLPNFSGYLWMRKTVDIPASWAGKELSLDLAMIDDNDFTYFNGTEVGHIEGCLAHRHYTVPADLVKAGKAVIAVRVMDTGGKGGIWGDKDRMFLSLSENERIPLAGTWKYKVAMRLSDAPDLPVNTATEANFPTFLYNAMIYPLLRVPIKGAIWYQGEANTSRSLQYQTLLPLMIQDWRKGWGTDFPFYIAQLANYQAVQTGPEESDWAELREAQLFTTRLENTGMAVLIDIGEADDIHPKNKAEVGRRLALNALALTYGKDISYSGPVYSSYRIEGRTVRLSFDHTDGGLKIPSGAALEGFYLAGADHKFHKATAVIEGDTVVVSSPEVEFPSSVRYGWANNPVCNLYNGAGLPASPFRTDSWRADD
ncbi:MAG: 9-O-acetylesterase [Bacteroidales bacterium]|nr:9-O-acetylesterase [Bacteroidales bacterium]